MIQSVLYEVKNMIRRKYDKKFTIPALDNCNDDMNEGFSG